MEIMSSRPSENVGAGSEPVVAPSAPSAARAEDAPAVPPRAWDAHTYRRVATPQRAWGRGLIAATGLRGDETLLDAGCGTGELTRLWAARVPRGRVIGIDASPAMVAQARRALADLAPRVTVLQGDLAHLDLPDPVDVVVSNAAFHWVLDHEALFARLFASLRPGGRLVAQCAGEGNMDRALDLTARVADEPEFRGHLHGFRRPMYYASAASTDRRLRAAGFTRVAAWTHPAPVDLGSVGDAHEFLAAVTLGPHLERLPPRLRERFVERVARALADRAGRVVLDYVRLDLRATRPDGGG